MLPDSILSKCKYVSARAPWFNIIKYQNEMLNNISWVFQNGARSLIWHHNWSTKGILLLLAHHLYSLTDHVNLSVQDVWNATSSDWHLFPEHPLFDREIEDWNSITSTFPIPNPDMVIEDTIWWNPSSTGIFFVKSLKCLLVNSHMGSPPMFIGFLWSKNAKFSFGQWSTKALIPWMFARGVSRSSTSILNCVYCVRIMVNLWSIYSHDAPILRTYSLFISLDLYLNHRYKRLLAYLVEKEQPYPQQFP